MGTSRAVLVYWLHKFLLHDKRAARVMAAGGGCGCEPGKGLRAPFSEFSQVARRQQKNRTAKFCNCKCSRAFGAAHVYTENHKSQQKKAERASIAEKCSSERTELHHDLGRKMFRSPVEHFMLIPRAALQLRDRSDVSLKTAPKTQGERNYLR